MNPAQKASNSNLESYVFLVRKARFFIVSRGCFWDLKSVESAWKNKCPITGGYKNLIPDLGEVNKSKNKLKFLD